MIFFLNDMQKLSCSQYREYFACKYIRVILSITSKSPNWTGTAPPATPLFLREAPYQMCGFHMGWVLPKYLWTGERQFN